MILPAKPFELAERYIQLRKKCSPDSWTDTMTLLSDMILMPIIVLFLTLTGRPDPMTAGMTVLKAYQSWKEYTEYIDLRFQVQMMLVYCQSVGGPFITTNDPKYMPYVLADAVQRKNQDLPTK